MKVNVKHPAMGFFAVPVALVIGWPLLGFTSGSPTHQVTLTVSGTGVDVPIEFVENGKSRKIKESLPWVYTYRAERYEPVYVSVKNEDIDNEIDVIISIDMQQVKEREVPNQSTVGVETFAMLPSTSR